MLDDDVLDDLRSTVVKPSDFGAAAAALAQAVVALANDEPAAGVESARVAKRLASRTAAVREALGLALYGVQDFRLARTELVAAMRLSGRGDLLAVIADTERALGRPSRAIELFEQANRAALAPDVAAELLLVAASAYGDLDRPASGVALLRRHAPRSRDLSDADLRLAYVEGSLAERAGDLRAARAAFTRVVSADPDFFDAAVRLESLSH